MLETISFWNHILLLGKYYIYSQKGQKGMPSLQGFITRIRCFYNIELYIARKRGTLNKHLSKCMGKDNQYNAISLAIKYCT